MFEINETRLSGSRMDNTVCPTHREHHSQQSRCHICVEEELGITDMLDRINRHVNSADGGKP